jgi:thiol:disulfide interchange protein DsbD
MATSVEWSLPPGLQAGALLWPAPEVYVSGGLTTYVYHGETMLVVPLTIASNAPPGARELKAKVAWLECSEACVPGEAQLTACLVIGAENRPSTEADRIGAARQLIPAPNPRLQLTAAWSGPATGAVRGLSIRGRGDRGFRPADFLAYPAEDYELLPGASNVLEGSDGFCMVKMVKRSAKEFPRRIEGLLLQTSTASASAIAVDATLVPDTGAVVPQATPPAAAHTGATVTHPGGIVSVAAMLGLAFLGGLVLNIMPCVLPVIALKVLGFVRQNQEAPLRVRGLGLWYGLGVVVSFLALAGTVIVVRQAGGAASWGMQMQNPYFRLVLLVVVVLVALNLFGLFEVSLGSRALGAASALAGREGPAGAFFNGVLATALATPCTAPFLTVALGFAFTQTAAMVVATFFSAALGLAVPYVALSWHPGWLRFLPKPGPWMQRFKTAMAFPMLATAVWLFDLAAPSFGDGGVLWLGLLLVVVGGGGWAWGEFVQRGERRRGWAVAVTAALTLGLSAGILEGPLDWRRSPSRGGSGADEASGTVAIKWQRWSPAAVARAREAGHPVLADFTARWCLTCKANERFALEVPEVRAKLEEVNAVALRADNTDPDPEIAAELKRHGRAGVPLVIVFPRRLERAPIVLPALLTPSLVREALAQAAQ